MRQTTPILFFLVILCVETQASAFFRGNSLKENILMNAHVTSSGIIDLQKDAYSTDSFYIPVDLSNYNYSQYPPSNSTNSPPSIIYVDTRKFVISLTNRETLIADNCLNFSTYDCNKYRCDRSNWTDTFDFPTFTANVQYAFGFIYLDYTHWSLTSESDYSYIAQSCQTGDNSSSLGSNRHGVLGLGTTSGSQNSKVFSIYINPNLTEGKLLLTRDTSTYTQSSSPSYTLYANATWQLLTYNGWIQVEGSAVSLNGNIMFDINSDAIGLPSLVYDAFIHFFGCVDSVTCYTTNPIATLPSNLRIFLTLPSNLTIKKSKFPLKSIPLLAAIQEATDISI